MKKNLLTVFFLAAAAFATAQQPIIVSIGGGFSGSSSSLKSKAYLGNGYNLQGEVFIPFARKGWDGSVKESGKIAWGVIAGGTYFTSKSLMPDIASTQAAYKLYSGSLTVTNEQNGASVNKGFIASAGLQAVFTFGRLSLSPSLSGGYFSIRQDGFTQRSTADSKPITLTELPGTKNTGFTTIPQIKISYPLTDYLHIYTSASLPIGPEISTTGRILVPAGGFNDQHTYEPAQLASGTMKEKSVNSSYQALHVNAGISWDITGSSRRLKGKVTKPGGNSLNTVNPVYEQGGNSGQNPIHNPSALAKPGNPIGGIIVKGGKNPGGNMMVITSNDKGEFELNGLETGNYQFTLTTPETPLKPNETAEAARPGNPIGGIIVKGGKNPGGNMTNLTVKEGTIQFDVLEAGNYKFIIQAPENNKGNNNNKKKVVEKATSGLKDTLKTNV